MIGGSSLPQSAVALFAGDSDKEETMRSFVFF
jgi:hypothetical protein